MPYTESVALAQAWQGSTLQPITGVGHRGILRAPTVVDLASRFVLAAWVGP